MTLLATITREQQQRYRDFYLGDEQKYIQSLLDPQRQQRVDAAVKTAGEDAAYGQTQASAVTDRNFKRFGKQVYPSQQKYIERMRMQRKKLAGTTAQNTTREGIFHADSKALEGVFKTGRDELRQSTANAATAERLDANRDAYNRQASASSGLLGFIAAFL